MAPYDDIGGTPAIRAALDALYPRVLAEARVPLEGYRNSSTIPQLNDQSIGGDLDALRCRGVNCQTRSTHATPSPIQPRVPAPSL